VLGQKLQLPKGKIRVRVRVRGRGRVRGVRGLGG
jgi:hypothetical protein